MILVPTYAVVVHLLAGGVANLPATDLLTCLDEARTQAGLAGNATAECRVTFVTPHFVVVDPQELR